MKVKLLQRFYYYLRQREKLCDRSEGRDENRDSSRGYIVLQGLSDQSRRRLEASRLAPLVPILQVLLTLTD